MLQRTPRTLVYLSADELGITPAERAGLIEVRDDLASGRVKHETHRVSEPEDWEAGYEYRREHSAFNMDAFAMPTICGTAHCIGGFMVCVGAVEFGEWSSALNSSLFYPRLPREAWKMINTDQAVRAIDYFLSGSGTNCWPLALADEPA